MERLKPGTAELPAATPQNVAAPDAPPPQAPPKAHHVRPRARGRGRRRARRRGWPLVLFVIALALIAGVVLARQYFKPTYYIAYVGTYRTPEFDDLHKLALEKYLGELSAEWHDARFVLQTFSNNQSANESHERYNQIVQDPKYIAAIDNTRSSHLLGVQSLIRDNKLPVVSMNADKLPGEYDNNVIFIGYEDDTPERVADFSAQVLKSDEVIFVGENSYPLTERYVAMIKSRGTKVSDNRVSTNKLSPDELAELKAKLNTQLADMRLRHARPTVILNTHAEWGDEIINHIDTHHENVDILGGPYIIDWKKYEFGHNDRGNRLILLTYPRDAVTNKIRGDLSEFKAKEPGVGRPNEQFFVKRCIDAVSIIRAAFYDGATGTFSEPSRAELDEFFRERTVEGKPVRTRNAIYSFNSDGLVADERTFEVYSANTSFGQLQVYGLRLCDPKPSTSRVSPRPSRTRIRSAENSERVRRALTYNLPEEQRGRAGDELARPLTCYLPMANYSVTVSQD